jgi:NAD(P)-dependent dehydrogenase (short-subunit alcohol dehydrogenase family)
MSRVHRRSPRRSQAIVERSGPVDILINNAGQAISAPLGKTDFEFWQQLLAVNLTGTYLCSQQALPAMVKRGFGRIVNVASTAGLTGYAYCTAYCAAKHGVVGFTRALAREVAKSRVTVNAVCPGYTETDIVRDAVANIRTRPGAVRTRPWPRSLRATRKAGSCSPTKSRTPCCGCVCRAAKA